MNSLKKDGPTGCAGCPCDCTGCTFSTTGARVVLQAALAAKVLVPEGDYGCVHGGSLVTLADGAKGLLRGDTFHGLTDQGAEFLRRTENPLAEILGL